MHRLYEPVAKLMQSVSTDVVLPHFRNLKTSDVTEKEPGDLVTIADKLSEEILSEGLSKLLPEAAVVGEEACSEDPSILDHLSNEIAWIIDPIDGTGNFARGKTPFGIIIALAVADETMAGWIFDPIKDRICHSMKDQGSFIDGKKVMSKNGYIGKPKAALATGFMTAQQRQETLSAAKPHFEIVPIPNCAAEQYPLLVSGDHNITIFERTLAWDHAAGILFLNEAGGKVCRWDGTAYHPSSNRTGLLGASSPALWEKAHQIFTSRSD